MIVAEEVGVQFFFDRHLRVVTPGEARIRGQSLTTWGLREVTFSIAQGAGTALIGPSGSGKTTCYVSLPAFTRPIAAGSKSPDAWRRCSRSMPGCCRCSPAARTHCSLASSEGFRVVPRCAPWAT